MYNSFTKKVSNKPFSSRRIYFSKIMKWFINSSILKYPSEQQVTNEFSHFKMFFFGIPPKLSTILSESHKYIVKKYFLTINQRKQKMIFSRYSFWFIIKLFQFFETIACLIIFIYVDFFIGFFTKRRFSVVIYHSLYN